MPDLLLELFSEEIPARMQGGAAKDLERLVVGALSDRGLLFEGAKSFAGPRRLTLAIHGLPAKQPDVKEERKGPRVGAPEKAIEGFLRSAGVTLAQCQKQSDGKGEFYVAVIGNANRQPTTPELAHMAALVDTLMQQGALGVWTALEYAPASYSTTNEIIALARAARRHGGIYASHMRNEGIQIDQALNELFRVAREADIPAEVSHLKVSGRDSWGQMRRVIARIDSARASGLDVTADQYPYIRAATALDASIPTWAESGGMDSLLARLRDPRTRARLRQEMLHPRGGAESFYYEAGGGAGVLITGTFQDSLRGLQGKTIAEIAAARHRDAVETLFDIVLAEGGHRTDAVYAVMSEPDVQEAMKTWWVAVNTDFGGVAPDGPLGSQSAHPRAYGTFARILGHYVRELKLFPLEFAVRKMTSLAAQRVGLGDRGLLAPGMAADITIFDANTVADRATFERPHQPSVGFAYVFVNGQKVLDHGALTAARPGRGLRGPGYVPPERRGR